MAWKVETQRGSVGEMNRISGMRSVAASSAVEPLAWTNALRPGSQKWVKTSR